MFCWLRSFWVPLLPLPLTADGALTTDAPLPLDAEELPASLIRWLVSVIMVLPGVLLTAVISRAVVLSPPLVADGLPALPYNALRCHLSRNNVLPAVCCRGHYCSFAVILQSDPTIHVLPCFASCPVHHVLPCLVVYHSFKYQRIAPHSSSSSLVFKARVLFYCPCCLIYCY